MVATAKSSVLEMTPLVDNRSDSPAPTIPLRVGVCLFAAVTCARYVFAANRAVFHIFPDEAAQLAVARSLAGRTEWSMLDSSTWQPGLGTLLAPAYYALESSELVYRVGIGLNAAFGGLAAVVLCVIVSKVTSLGVQQAAVLSAATALMPAALVSSSHLWAEPMVTLTFLVSLLCVLEFLDTDRPLLGHAAIGASAVGYAAHGRMLPYFVLSVAIVIGATLRRRETRHAIGALATSGVLFALVHIYSDYVVRTVWTNPASTNTVGSTLRRLGSPVSVLDAAVGQAWYQLAASLGLVGLGVFALIRSGRVVDEAIPLLPHRSSAAIVALYVTVGFATSAVFMAGRSEPHYFIYGRYNDAVVWPLVAIGAGWAVHTRTAPLSRVTRAVAGVIGVILVLSFAVSGAHGEQLAASIGVREMVAGVLPFVVQRDSADAIIIGLAASGLLAAIVAGLRVRIGRTTATATALPVFVLGFGVLTYLALEPDLNQAALDQDVRIVRELVPPGTQLGFHFVGPEEPSWVLVPVQRRLFQTYQFYLDDYRLVPDTGVGDAVGPYVLAPRQDPGMVESGARALWESHNSGMVLWVEPSTP